MKPRSDQIRFLSSANGSVILDAYLEAAEKGGRSLGDILADLFDATTGEFRAEIFQFREEPSSAGQLQYRIGDFVDPEEGWISLLSHDLASFVVDAELAAAEAAASALLAQTAETNALASRDEAESFKDLTYAYSQSAASAVAYQNLAAIAASKAVTAVDVFVYDTSKDSDGGEWRKRCSHTSWYNETLNTATRGSRREFPAVAVLVLEANKLTIYDADDPSLPMWMVADVRGESNAPPYGMTAIGGQANSLSSVAALNGQLCLTGSGGYGSQSLIRWDFICDRFGNQTLSVSFSGWTNAGLKNRNVVSSYVVALPTIVSAAVHDVAMTVRPGAPVDLATGLPIPTIAVATDGGVSVVKDNGSVVDVSFIASRNYSATVDFTADNWIFATTSNVGTTPAAWFPVLFEIPASDAVNVGTSSGDNGVGFQSILVPPVGYSPFEAGTAATASKETLFVGKASGLWQIPVISDDALSVSQKNMVSFITSNYTTGWMVGDIQGAWLSSTDTSSLVGSGELVTNGAFATDVSGWTPSGTGGTTFSWNASGYMEVTRSGDTVGHPYQTISVTPGKTYRIDATISGSGAVCRIGTSIGGSEVTSFGATTTSTLFTPTTSNVHLAFWGNDGATISVDNISVKLADFDRSTNSKGLIVNGTITRTPVATGAELVGYSGFSASNYLEQPYNSDLDFGTGDFSIMGWLKTTSTSNEIILWREDTAEAGARFAVDLVAGALRFVVEASTLSSMRTINDGRWTFFAVTRTSGVATIYLNGSSAGSATMSSNVDNASAVLRVGLRANASASGSGLSGLSLLRISGTAVTADQVAKAYRDELPLFQENAAATLYGSSGEVKALAHDPDTNLLHVGTPSGRSVFSGLRRVSNTTVAVGSAISAANGLVVEE